MWNIYNLIYVNVFRFFSFTEELRGGKYAKMKTFLVLSLFGVLNILALTYILKKYNVINVYDFINLNFIICAILLHLVIYFIHFLAYSNFKYEHIILLKLESSNLYKSFSYAITFCYFLLSLVFMGVS
jgi:hypothetical protein